MKVTVLRLAWVPFIEDLSEALTSGLVAGSRNSESMLRYVLIRAVAGAWMASAQMMVEAIYRHEPYGSHAY